MEAARSRQSKGQLLVVAVELITHLYLETGEEMVNQADLVVEVEQRLLVLALETLHL